MSIYNNTEILELNNIDLYAEGLQATENALNISRKIINPIDEKFNIFLYWTGLDVDYKHSVVIKSFLATQNLNNATLKIYSDKDISKNSIFDRYKKFKQVEFHYFDIEEEVKNTKFENFKYISEIKNHTFNTPYESDFFRLFMLYKYGGIYIDFDVLLLRDISPLLKYDFFYQWGSYPNNINRINGAIMHLKKDSNVNKVASSIILNSEAKPGISSLHWASDLYVQTKLQCPELVIFPAAFFNSEWQSNHLKTTGGLLEPLKKHEYSNDLFEGCFTWHWHNRWKEHIEKGSKFNILDSILENKFVKIQNNEN